MDTFTFSESKSAGSEDFGTLKRVEGLQETEKNEGLIAYDLLRSEEIEEKSLAKALTEAIAECDAKLAQGLINDINKRDSESILRIFNSLCEAKKVLSLETDRDGKLRMLLNDGFVAESNEKERFSRTIDAFQKGDIETLQDLLPLHQHEIDRLASVLKDLGWTVEMDKGGLHTFTIKFIPPDGKETIILRAWIAHGDPMNGIYSGPIQYIERVRKR